MDFNTTDTIKDTIKAHYKRQIDFYKKLYDDTSNQLYYERTQNEKLRNEIKSLKEQLTHLQSNHDSMLYKSEKCISCKHRGLLKIHDDTICTVCNICVDNSEYE